MSPARSGRVGPTGRPPTARPPRALRRRSIRRFDHLVELSAGERVGAPLGGYAGRERERVSLRVTEREREREREREKERECPPGFDLLVKSSSQVSVSEQLYETMYDLWRAEAPIAELE